MVESRANICIDCEKSCGFCAWSAKLQPVAGWTATPMKRKTNDKRVLDGYIITECPRFEPSDREANFRLWTDWEIKTLRESLEAGKRYKDIAAILGRSYRAVQFKAAELNYKRSTENESH